MLLVEKPPPSGLPVQHLTVEGFVSFSDEETVCINAGDRSFELPLYVFHRRDFDPRPMAFVSVSLAIWSNGEHMLAYVDGLGNQPLTLTASDDSLATLT